MVCLPQEAVEHNISLDATERSKKDEVIWEKMQAKVQKLNNIEVGNGQARGRRRVRGSQLPCSTPRAYISPCRLRPRKRRGAS